MHPLNKCVSLAVVLALGLPAQQPAKPLPGQAPKAEAPDEPSTIRVDTRLVVLHCSVMDKSGKQITNLGLDQFKVFENGAPQPIKLFRREDIPVSIGIVIDNSGSMRDKRQKVEAAAVQLVKASNPQDEVFVVNFNEDAYLDVPFTNDIKKMEEGVARIDSHGGTAFRDAVSMSIDHLKQEGKKDKKVILLITDGNDTASVAMTLEKLVEKSHKSEVLIYTIGVFGKDDQRDEKKARRAMDALTRASGGLSYYPSSIEEVESVAKQVAHDIRNQYVVAYSPVNQELDGSFRQIKVTAGGSRYSVRHRTGYYATAEAPRRRQQVSQNN